MRVYEPKILVNPTGNPFEFRCDGKVVAFKPYERRLLDGYVAYHALTEINGPLVEYHGDMGEKNFSDDGIAYEDMGWRKLVSLASERGFYKAGMTRTQVLAKLKETDE